MGRLKIHSTNEVLMTKTLKVDIQGMTCASCVGRVEKYLSKNDAVISSAVNLATEKATIMYRPDKIDQTGIIKIIEQAGYQANISKSTDDTNRVQSLKREKASLLICTFLTIPLVLP